MSNKVSIVNLAISGKGLSRWHFEHHKVEL